MMLGIEISNQQEVLLGRRIEDGHVTLAGVVGSDQLGHGVAGHHGHLLVPERVAENAAQD
jgi:hypothetical protein